jgi:hypothetical protein
MRVRGRLLWHRLLTKYVAVACGCVRGKTMLGLGLGVGSCLFGCAPSAFCGVCCYKARFWLLFGVRTEYCPRQLDPETFRPYDLTLVVRLPACPRVCLKLQRCPPCVRRQPMRCACVTVFVPPPLPAFPPSTPPPPPQLRTSSSDGSATLAGSLSVWMYGQVSAASAAMPASTTGLVDTTSYAACEAVRSWSCCLLLLVAACCCCTLCAPLCTGS